jgi:hypothetical protein
MVNLNISSIILGNNNFNNGLDYYIAGFVFIYINHTLYYASIIKSYPNNSKHYFRPFTFILRRTENIVRQTIYFILLSIVLYI